MEENNNNKTYRDIYTFINEYTKDFSINSGSLPFSTKTEAENAEKILSRYYNNVERSGLDYDRAEIDGVDYVVKFSEPKEIVEGFAEGDELRYYSNKAPTAGPIAGGIVGGGGMGEELDPEAETLEESSYIDKRRKALANAGFNVEGMVEEEILNLYQDLMGIEPYDKEKIKSKYGLEEALEELKESNEKYLNKGATTCDRCGAELNCRDAYVVDEDESDTPYYVCGKCYKNDDNLLREPISGQEDEFVNYEFKNKLTEANDILNQDIWNKNNELRPEVREKLFEITGRFIDNLNRDGIELEVKDIVIIGSNANYNYNDESDIDLHIIADTSIYENKEDLAMKLYQAYKTLFNNKYDPTIRGHEVEIYVEPDSIKANSNGMYSLNSGWIKEPVRTDIPEVDQDKIDELLQPYIDRFNTAESISDIDTLIDNLYLLRQQSILTEGEYGIGNLVFKEFRNRGYLKKLKEKKVELETKKMSLEKLEEGKEYYDIHSAIRELNEKLVYSIKTNKLINGELVPWEVDRVDNKELATKRVQELGFNKYWWDEIEESLNEDAQDGKATSEDVCEIIDEFLSTCNLIDVEKDGCFYGISYKPEALELCNNPELKEEIGPINIEVNDTVDYGAGEEGEDVNIVEVKLSFPLDYGAEGFEVYFNYPNSTFEESKNNLLERLNDIFSDEAVKYNITEYCREYSESLDESQGSISGFEVVQDGDEFLVTSYDADDELVVHGSYATEEEAEDALDRLVAKAEQEYYKDMDRDLPPEMYDHKRFKEEIVEDLGEDLEIEPIDMNARGKHYCYKISEPDGTNNYYEDRESAERDLKLLNNYYNKLNEDVNVDKQHALAKYLGYEKDSMVDTDDGQTFTTYDDSDFLVLTEEEAYDKAVEEIKMIWDDLGIDSFSSNFQNWILDNTVNHEWFDKWIEENNEEAKINNEPEDIIQTDDSIQTFRDIFGDEEFSKVIEEKGLVDLDKVAEEAISLDGVAHFLSYYDGKEIDLGNGLYAYRVN